MYIKEISKKVKIQFTALKAEQNFLHERYQGGGDQSQNRTDQSGRK